MRYNSSFQRTDETSVERSSCPDWLENFAKNLSTKTAVEVNKDTKTPSIYEMMSSIVNKQKPKFSSVEEAVKSYQERAGLSEYIKRTANKNIEDLAKNIIEASIEESTNLIPENEDSADAPAIIKDIPELENYIINSIETNHGIQIPALLHSIIEVFGRNGIDQQIFTDIKLLKWLNKIIINTQHKHQQFIPCHIGRDVGIKIDYTGKSDSNTNPFTLLEIHKA